ncbi:MAG: hypothetical protein ACYCVM_01560, partial [Acidiferrobacter sp.]
EEAPSGATMEEVFDRLGPVAGELAKVTSHHGITPTDPLWSAVQTLLDIREERSGTEAAAGRAADAATRIEAATQGVGETIFNQTVRAGDELKTLLKQALEEKTLEVGRTVVDVIRYSANEGATAIKKAAAGLPAAATAQRGAILADWQAALTTLATQEAAERARRGEWWVIGAAAAFGLVMAVAGLWIGYQMAPRAWPAASPPALVANFGKEAEFQWDNTSAFTPSNCPQGRVCVVLKK